MRPFNLGVPPPLSINLQLGGDLFWEIGGFCINRMNTAGMCLCVRAVASFHEEEEKTCFSCFKRNQTLSALPGCSSCHVSFCFFPRAPPSQTPSHTQQPEEEDDGHEEEEGVLPVVVVVAVVEVPVALLISRVLI